MENVSGGNGTFANETFYFGPPAWTAAAGGSGPPQNVAFQNTPLPTDSYVLGLTGMSTTTNMAVGNGTAVTQPAAITNSILHNPLMWVALAVVGVAYVLHKK